MIDKPNFELAINMLKGFTEEPNSVDLRQSCKDAIKELNNYIGYGTFYHSYENTGGGCMLDIVRWNNILFSCNEECFGWYANDMIYNISHADELLSYCYELAQNGFESATHYRYDLSIDAKVTGPDTRGIITEYFTMGNPSAMVLASVESYTPMLLSEAHFPLYLTIAEFSDEICESSNYYYWDEHFKNFTLAQVELKAS